jgi:hypothetical protein
MRFVQYLPPAIIPDLPADTVEAVTGVRPIAPHEPPAQPAARLDTERPALEQPWTARPVGADQDRRKYCRRIRHEPVLEELRSGHDRRHRNQRRSDITTAIDETI